MHEPFDAVGAIASLFGGDALLKELMQRGAIAREVVRGDGIATARADLEDIDDNNTPRAGDDLDALAGDEVVELLGAVLQDPPFSVDPQDSGRAFKRIEHDGDAAVARLVEVRGRLDPRARQVHVPELADHDLLAVARRLWDHPEKGPRPVAVRDPLRRHVDAPFP